MKRLIIIPLILILAISCLPVTTVTPEVTNEMPIAYIDSISMTRIFQGEKISFNGHGTDADGTIVAYEWRSSLDGVLSTSKSFSTSILSAGKKARAKRQSPESAAALRTLRQMQAMLRSTIASAEAEIGLPADDPLQTLARGDTED